jgi:hypothetical protein
MSTHYYKRVLYPQAIADHVAAADADLVIRDGEVMKDRDGILQLSQRYASVWPNRHASDDEMQAAVEKVWTEFWVPIFTRDQQIEPHIPPYSPFIEFIKAELFDYHQMMSNTAALMCEVSGGQVSKPLTDYEVVEELAREHYNRFFKEDVLEWIGGLIEEADDLVSRSMYESVRAGFIEMFGDLERD